MRILLAAFSTAILAYAGVDGVVMNGTTGKPQSGATVTLFQTSNQGPQDLGSVKSDAQGKFVFTQDVKPGQGGGPLLLQAVYNGVQYNKIVTPGMPVTGVDIPVYEALKTPGGAKLEQHMILLEPSSAGEMRVSETYLFKNDGKTTWNDPDRGTLPFSLPDAAQGKVEINVLAPGGMPIRRAADPGPRPNTFKLDFPIKPGDSRIDLVWTMPFKTPGMFESHVLAKGGLIRMVVPQGVTLKGPDLETLGQEPTSKATIYNVKGPDLAIAVEGSGTLQDPSAGGDEGGAGSPGLSENLPKLYALAAGNSSLIDSFLAVKWILLTIAGMLALGFVTLYRKGNPLARAASSGITDSSKASGNARSRS